MKKAKRLLAVLLAAVMLASAACLPVYAKVSPGSLYTDPKKMTNNKMYEFDAEQGCAKLLDKIDGMLEDAYIKISIDQLIKDNAINLGSLGSSIIGFEYIDLTSIDELCNTIDNIFDFADGALGWIVELITGDLLKSGNLQRGPFDNSIDRGYRSNNYDNADEDLRVLYNIVGFLNANADVLSKILAGTLSLGALDGTIKGIEIMGIELLKDPDEGIKSLLYNLLINDTTTTVPAGMTIEDMAQQLIDWALIYGTGESAENGGHSLLGMNHEPLMPVLADTEKYPGGAAITGVPIQVDRNGDGIKEQDTMDFYQLVNNAINGLLNGILAPMLGDLVADLVGVEITEQYPKGDPAILTDALFATILGAVEGLLVSNGADPVVYSEAEGEQTPMGKINDLVEWLLNGSKGGKPALYTFINIDYYGIGLTDNFMSLLNDLVRLAINLLPALGIELPADSGLPSADELTATYWYKHGENGEVITCLETDEGAVDQLFMTFYGERLCYATYTDETKKEVDYYTYVDTGMPVNIADSTAADYENPDFIRAYYQIPMDNVWAALVKMLFSMFVEGPYFPEWTTDMASVLAYGCAGLAVSILPEENFYARLDAYHITGSTDPYTSAGKTVYPIAYSDSTLTRSVSALPTGAMSILSAVGAYYLNTMLDLSESERLTTHNTSFEQFLAELALWGFTEYVPVLAGELDEAGDHVRTAAYTDGKGSQHPVGTFYQAVNKCIDAIYEDFSERKLLANPNFDAVYELVDNTLLKLIPASWLPDEFGSSHHLFNNWLFGNLMEFDLQGILSILSVNPDGELGEPVLTVLLRVIDRVLAIVFGGNAILIPHDRSGEGSNSVFARNTSITTLTALLEDGDGAENSYLNASLPSFLGRIIKLLNTYRAPLIETFLPMLMQGAYERPSYKNNGTEQDWQNVLGNDMTKYKIEDLENQIDYLTRDVNADYYATYSNLEEAEEAAEGLEDAYVREIEVQPSTVTTEAVYEYKVFTSRHFMDAATRNEVTDEENGNYATYSNFQYKSIYPATPSQPLVEWDDGAYYFWESEDTNPYGYYYRNFNKAIDNAETFVSDYHGFISNDMSSAFGEWLIYSIEQELLNANLYDPNDDGRCVTSESDPDYVAATTDESGNVIDPGYPVDGYPSLPSSMYPYLSSSTDTTTVSWVDYLIDSIVSVKRNEVNENNFEIIKLAKEWGQDSRNFVELSLWDTENVARFALGTMEFDITANADGSYDGQYQWEDLGEVQLASIANYCSSHYMHFEYDVATGVYKIYRYGFAFITDNFYLGTVDGTNIISAAPVASRPYVYDPSAHVEAQQVVYDGYKTFLDSLYAKRRSLYNNIDIINWRMKEAERMRKTAVDTTMLEWAIEKVKPAYAENGKRNMTASGVVNGVTQYTKIYTQNSYNRFREAYDFATSIRDNKGQATGLTQSMVTKAFQELLAAYNALVLFTGPADWVQFLEILAQAKDLADPDGIRNDPELGFETESIAVLDDVISEADALYAIKDNLDCENQAEIDTMVTAIENAILQLKYLSDPKLKPSTSDEAGDTRVIETSTGNRTIGHIIGLIEGQGITMDLVEEYGMIVNETVANDVTISESSKGLGTGAYYRGRVGGIEKFRYYAVLYGDLNGDARIDGTDWSRLRYAVITGGNESTAGMGGDYIYEAADVDHDGDVDSIDATLIRDYYNYAYTISQKTYSTD